MPTCWFEERRGRSLRFLSVGGDFIALVKWVQHQREAKKCRFAAEQRQDADTWRSTLRILERPSSIYFCRFLTFCIIYIYCYHTLDTCLG
ncbi:hypothetical protein Scep_007017 [Stephania cephalantha]|uniref:Uncharacterized protein n=1 Tax=Stephania cephalantha TaxID=152367 RepID=A0AAP0KBR6_9MAGN